MRTQAYINGEFVPAADGRTFEDVSPRDGSVIAAVARGGEEDIDRAVRAARAAFDRGEWALIDPAKRKRVLLKLASLIDEHRDELAELESVDVGHPITDARRVDVPGTRNCFSWYAEAIDKVYGEIAPTGVDALALVGREPLGVVGAVVPWNYPLIVTSWKLAPALATGNSVVLKPAEQSPLSALMLAELASQAGLPDGVLNVVPGFGEEAGGRSDATQTSTRSHSPGRSRSAGAFSATPGSRTARRCRLSSAARVRMSCSPTPGTSTPWHRRSAGGSSTTPGQTCHAGSRVVVDRSVAGELRERIVEFAGSFVPADPALPDTKLGSLVSEEHLNGVLARVDAAAASGGAHARRRAAGASGPGRVVHEPDGDRGRGSK